MAISSLAPKCTGLRLSSALIFFMAGIAAIPAQTAQPVPAAKEAMPDEAKVTLLIQTYIAALSHANLTGNYTVLHDMASPAFQSLNSTAQLAQKFAAFRNQGIDIGPAILLPPILSGPPALDGDLLRVSGHYETRPQRVVFDMAFQAVNKAWRLAGIAVSTVAPKAAEQSQLRIQIPTAARPGGPAKR